jgi:hypothetical protein
MNGWRRCAQLSAIGPAMLAFTLVPLLPLGQPVTLQILSAEGNPNFMAAAGPTSGTVKA